VLTAAGSGRLSTSSVPNAAPVERRPLPAAVGDSFYGPSAYSRPMPENNFSRRDFTRILGVGALVAAAPPVLRAAAGPATTVLLNSNENPWGPSPAAMRAMQDALARVARYPDSEEESLVNDLARMHGVGADQVLLGVGSSDILRLAADAYLAPGKTAVTADPTFEIIAMHSQRIGATIKRVPLTPSYAHDLDAMGEGDLVYICNPNNPTGTITPKAKVRAFLESVPRSTIVLVDEAYHHYVTSSEYESVIPLVATYPNLIVARTFSKIYALAGARCGYAVAQKATIEALQAQQQFNVSNLLAAVAARASLADEKFVREGRERNKATKEWLSHELTQMGLPQLPSEANFVMIGVGRDVKPLIAAMREKNVRVGRKFPALPQHLRVTIGTPEEMKRFVSAFREAMASG
jgi:histidinol-phosphate aminotransferase